MADSKKMKNSWTPWSFDCGSTGIVESPAKRPRSDIKRKETPVPSITQSFVTTNKREKLSSLPELLKACEPRQASELAVSRQKQKEISDWLDSRAAKAKPRALILSGPSGCGKTVSFKLLAKDNGYECIEWITPADQGTDENNRYTRQTDKFEDFMVRTTRYNSLFDDCSRLLIVKDFPNIYFTDTDAFISLLERYFAMGKESIIFICTDTGGIGVLQNLFPPKTRERFGIDHISINPVTQVMTKNLLKRVSGIFNAKASHMMNVTPEIMEEILSNSIGDIRSTIINLIFASLKVENSKKGCEARGRGESLGLLHAVGRVINPKRIVSGNSWKFLHDPDEIAYFFQTQPSTFVRFLHENHLNTTRAIEQASTATDILSVADLLVSEWRDAKLGRLGLSFCIHGIMTTNENPVTAWNPVRKPPNDEKVSRDLASAETSWYESLINPQTNSVSVRTLKN
ncbi:cell cycle checkpoint protein RAD17 [Athalia rosae]|uniref:cell cycle checkpoint protein RAD17 n=1 Tax=Athalia rosae TaxID=37344 RepID=UPI002034706E|nr:cell cycle checkpoint protein RAD17 [Athalia rosae]